jgi:hypothetical protein
MCPFYCTHMQVQLKFYLMPCTYQDHIQPCALHFAVKTVQFLQLLFVLNSSDCSGLELLAECKPHW